MSPSNNSKQTSASHFPGNHITDDGQSALPTFLMAWITSVVKAKFPMKKRPFRKKRLHKTRTDFEWSSCENVSAHLSWPARTCLLIGSPGKMFSVLPTWGESWALEPGSTICQGERRSVKSSRIVRGPSLPSSLHSLPEPESDSQTWHRRSSCRELSPSTPFCSVPFLHLISII